VLLGHLGCSGLKHITIYCNGNLRLAEKIIESNNVIYIRHL
jgi:hypothetical protein